jgi:UPF0755 protein
MIKLKQKNPLRSALIVVTVLLVLIIGALAATATWYVKMLDPVDPSSSEEVLFELKTGESSRTIAERLENEKLIKNARAFLIYLMLTGNTSNLVSGSYVLKASWSVSEIVDLISDGKVSSFEVTFLPGGTLSDARNVLLALGYSAADVDAALTKNYDHLALKSKPESADLEGYIFGDTYKFDYGATAEDIIKRCLDEFYKVIRDEDLTAKYQGLGLSLYEGITLASIVQREVFDPADQKQVAQVFYKRLAEDMMLGSDVTYQYAAGKLGVERDVNLDSPYNTRRYKGLPPGPIAAPGVSALLAVAAPADGDYLYFLSGDDDKTYFARTLYEHEQNIINYCQVKCSIL